jgi:hypothetical protein
MKKRQTTSESVGIKLASLLHAKTDTAVPLNRLLQQWAHSPQSDVKILFLKVGYIDKLLVFFNISCMTHSYHVITNCMELSSTREATIC